MFDELFLSVRVLFLEFLGIVFLVEVSELFKDLHGALISAVEDVGWGDYLPQVDFSFLY